MGSVKLSILIPAIPERMNKLSATLHWYNEHIEKYNLKEQVELLSIIDNKKRSIGRKRSDLIAIAQGEYVAMSDDDDYFTEAYFENIESAINEGQDVITYWQYARINKLHTFVSFGLRNDNQPEMNRGITCRPAWHCCTWKRDLIKDIMFGDSNYGEDDKFATEANVIAKTEKFIDQVCHVYQHDSNLTAAPGI